jgi:hypothetical protein
VSYAYISWRKAWGLYQHTKGFPIETVFGATVYLEETTPYSARRKDRHGTIALHYLIFAMRQTRDQIQSAWECCARCAGRSHGNRADVRSRPKQRTKTDQAMID